MKTVKVLETPVGNITAEICDGSFYDIEGKTLNVSVEKDGIEINLVEVTCDPENRELRIVFLDPHSQRNLTQFCFVAKENKVYHIAGIDDIFEKLDKQIDENKAQGKFKSVFEIEEEFDTEDKKSYIVNHLLTDEEDDGFFDEVIEEYGKES